MRENAPRRLKCLENAWTCRQVSHLGLGRSLSKPLGDKSGVEQSPLDHFNTSKVHMNCAAKVLDLLVIKTARNHLQRSFP